MKTKINDCYNEKYYYIIIGLEKIDNTWLDQYPDLKLIVKRGIGVDNIDLDECKRRDIIVCNTPDAPSNAVAELTICQMLNMLRKVPQAGLDRWNRYVGRELSECMVGIIGYGRIGLSVDMILRNGFFCFTYVNDIKNIDFPNTSLKYGYETTIERIYKECDIITLHIPLKDKTIDNTNFITKKELDMMKPNVRLLNMSRGGIINESDLYEWLKTHKKATCAIDSYVKEPYNEKLRQLKNIYLTPHLGSCTVTSKEAMQKQAEEEAQRYLSGKDLLNRVI